MIDADVHALLRPYLLDGERLLWTGRPETGIKFRRQDVLLIPFSLLSGGFALFWNVLVWTMGAPLVFLLWGIPFLLAGLYITVGRFIHDALVRAGLVYAVTDRRVLILRTGRWGRLRSLEIAYLPMLELEEKGNGRGTVRFDLEETFNIWGNGGFRAWMPSSGSRLCFEGIDQPRIPYDLIRREADRKRAEQIAARPPGRDFIG